MYVLTRLTTNSNVDDKMQTSFEQTLARARQNPGTIHRLRPEQLRGLQRIRVPADGLCLWTSLAMATQVVLQSSEPIDAQSSSVRRSARRWRLAIAAEMWDENKKELREPYAPFWAPGEMGGGSAQSARAYVQSLRAGEIWGGALEIQAATAIAPVNIAVIDIDARNAPHLIAYGNATRGHTLLLTRRNGHYDAVAKKNPCPEGQA